MAKMWRVEGAAENSYFRDGINPGPCAVLNKEEAIEGRRQIARKILGALKVHEPSLHTKSWLNFTPKLRVRLQAKF
jgi:hypothetical protein